MYLQCVVIFCLSLVQNSLCHDDIHRFMSERQIQEVFQTDADSVQEHEVVNIRLTERLKKRGISAGTRLSLRAFGKNTNVWLYPTDSILFDDETPIYLARHAPAAPAKVSFTPYSGLMKQMRKRLLENPSHLASMIIGNGGINRGRRSVNGYIGSKNLAIRSVPRNVIREYLRKRRSIDDIDDSSNYHVVYRTNENIRQNYSRPIIEQIVPEERITQSTPSKIPSILYPEILVIVDYSMYSPYARQKQPLLEYLLAFFNGVDLKYRVLENPRVRLHIAGIIFEADPQALLYISKNTRNQTLDDPQALPYISKNTRNQTIKIEDAMTGAGKFTYDIKDLFPSESFDVSVTLTRLGLSSNLAGVAFPNGACRILEDDKMTFKATLVHDNRAFLGIPITAHELGHTFGMRDEYDNKVKPECAHARGFIMAGSVMYTENSSTFSQCSLNGFQERLDGQYLTCLYNVPPRLGNNMPKLMPGKVVSLEKQCAVHCAKYNFPPGRPCTPERGGPLDICMNFACMENDRCTRSGVAAVDGTPCGNGNGSKPMFCLHQRCVHLN